MLRERKMTARHESKRDGMKTLIATQKDRLTNRRKEFS
jgi:hypothetical protein